MKSKFSFLAEFSRTLNKLVQSFVYITLFRETGFGQLKELSVIPHNPNYIYLTTLHSNFLNHEHKYNFINLNFRSKTLQSVLTFKTFGSCNLMALLGLEISVLSACCLSLFED